MISKKIGTITFKAFMLPENGSKNSTLIEFQNLNWSLKILGRRRSVTFSEVAGFLKVKLIHGCCPRFLNCKNRTKSRNAYLQCILLSHTLYFLFRFYIF